MRPLLGLSLLSLGSISLAAVVPAPLAVMLDAPTTQPKAAVPAEERPLVQIALLLDTSNSMDGLINQARSQLWTIVNEIGKAKRNGQTPRLQVALFEYGNDRLSPGEGYVRMVLPFTSNLDDVSEKLFALTTNGGSEFCGQVIDQANKSLAWSSDANVYKTIFIAGNEPFTQGSIDYRATVPMSQTKGIVVNTIHCGPAGEGVEGGWASGAKLGGGAFSNIDQNRDRIAIRCPQDDKIATLSVRMNVTYLPYGSGGGRASLAQRAQDDNAASRPGDSGVQRAAAKAGANYDNRGWDVVDAVKAGELDLSKAKDEELPESLRNKSAVEREKLVTEASAERDAVRAEINQLMAERERYLAENAPKDDGAATLDAAIVAAVREQMKANRYAFDAK